MAHLAWSGFLCVFAVCFQIAYSKNWALLVAGSSGYDNYRHQADICHAYHIMRNHGVPQENIVTMMYDDIAFNEENPFPGNIINQPNGTNLYPGVVIDYKGKDVTPEVFLAVLEGNAKKVKMLTGHTGKVIKSGANDHIFVNFADHGAPDLLAFPDDMLYAKALAKTLKSMHTNNRYKKMVLYIEACESGSMFAGHLPSDINVFATTAANPDQSSYACYFDEKRSTYLGDVYSVNWMQDSDKENLEKETLRKQFKITKKETNTSHVMEYGDLTISRMVVGEFQGTEQAKRSMTSTPPPPHPTVDAVRAPDVKYHILQHRVMTARTQEERRAAAQKLWDLEKRHSEIDGLFRSMVDWVREKAVRGDGKDGVLRYHSDMTYDLLKRERLPLTQHECYEDAVSGLLYACPGVKPSQTYRVLGQLNILVNLCERRYQALTVLEAVLMAANKARSLCANN